MPLQINRADAMFRDRNMNSQNNKKKPIQFKSKFLKNFFKIKIMIGLALANTVL